MSDHLSRRQVTTGFLGAIAAPLLAGNADAKSDPVSTHIAIDNNRVWSAATIDGSEPLLFVLDTGGAVQSIRPDIASRLKLKVLSGSAIEGLGAKKALGSLVLARNLRFDSGLIQPATVFTTYAFGGRMGADAAGTLAAGILTAGDNELDFEAGVWRRWRVPRSDFADLTRMTANISEIRSSESPRLVATATIDGKTYRLLLDTGASGIMLFPNAARRSGLHDDTRPFAPTPTVGYGGLAAKPSRVVRASRFEMNPLGMDRPLITVMDPTQTLAAEAEHDGLVGLNILQLLTLATDMRSRGLWAKRNARPVQPERYRLAGLWLDRGRSGEVVVGIVGTGSPAADAGVRVGDIIADPPLFDAALRAVEQPHVRVAVRSGDVVAERSWTLRPYL